MVWRQAGDKPLFEPMMVSVLMYNTSLGLNKWKSLLLLCWIVFRWSKRDCLDSPRLLSSPAMVALGLSVGYETRPLVGWCYGFCDWLKKYWLVVSKVPLTHWVICLNENCVILSQISLKFIPIGLTDNKPALVQIMAWHSSGAKPLSEQILTCSLMHICITRSGWVNHALWAHVGIPALFPKATDSHCVQPQNIGLS